MLGLVDANESPEAAALRELHEETGYIVHKAKSISAISYNDVGITNTCSQVVHVEVSNYINFKKLSKRKFFRLTVISLKIKIRNHKSTTGSLLKYLQFLWTRCTRLSWVSRATQYI